MRPGGHVRSWRRSETLRHRAHATTLRTASPTHQLATSAKIACTPTSKGHTPRAGRAMAHPSAASRSSPRPSGGAASRRVPPSSSRVATAVRPSPIAHRSTEPAVPSANMEHIRPQMESAFGTSELHRTRSQFAFLVPCTLFRSLLRRSVHRCTSRPTAAPKQRTGRASTGFEDTP